MNVVVPVIWQDLMSCDNTFPSRAHALCRWYGLRDFVVLVPAPNMEDIVSENRVNILLSSFAIAANNTSWLVTAECTISMDINGRLFCGCSYTIYLIV